MAPPPKKGYGPLGAEAKKFMIDSKKPGGLEINLNEGDDQFMMLQSQKMPGLKEYDFNTIQPEIEQIN